MSVNEAVGEYREEGSQETSPVALVDRIGIGVSAACALHCLAMPVLLALTPTLSSVFVVGAGMERLLGISAVVLALACLCWGYRIHRKKRLIASFVCAAVFMVWGQMFAEGALEVALVVLGGLGLIGSHFLNRVLCKSCRDCCAHSH